MADVKASNKKIAGCNFVAQDQIWKDHVKHEQGAAKLWPQNWDFLTTKYEESRGHIFLRKPSLLDRHYRRRASEKPGPNMKSEIRLRQKLLQTVSCVTLYKLVKDENSRKDRPRKELPPHLQPPPVTPIEKYIKVGPSPKPVPTTTAKMIGWRSGLPQLQLERYGKYANPKGGLVKQLNWPEEAVE